MGKLMRLLDAGRQRASTLQAEVNAPSGGGAGRYTASPGVAELTSWEQAEMAARDKTSCNVDPAGAASDAQLQVQWAGGRGGRGGASGGDSGGCHSHPVSTACRPASRSQTAMLHVTLAELMRELETNTQARSGRGGRGGCGGGSGGDGVSMCPLCMNMSMGMRDVGLTIPQPHVNHDHLHRRWRAERRISTRKRTNTARRCSPHQCCSLALALATVAAPPPLLRRRHGRRASGLSLVEEEAEVSVAEVEQA
jgi:hypothetical protein